MEVNSDTEEEGQDYTGKLAEELAEMLPSESGKSIADTLKNSWTQGGEKRCTNCARWAHTDFKTCCRMCDEGIVRDE